MPKRPPEFRFIDPINPPSPDGEFSCLAPVVRESATWFFCDPVAGVSSEGLSSVGSFRVSEVYEALAGAQTILSEQTTSGRKASADSDPELANRGRTLVDRFCDRFIAKKPAYQLKLSSGRTIGQRQVLCAEALSHCDKAALSIRDGRRDEVCSLMGDMLELICEVRRCLDREAGSTIAARRARQRHEKTYQMRARACQLYDAQKWPSVRKAAQRIHPKIVQYAITIGTRLSEDSGEKTVYDWLRAHKHAMAAA